MSISYESAMKLKIDQSLRIEFDEILESTNVQIGIAIYKAMCHKIDNLILGHYYMAIKCNSHYCLIFNRPQKCVYYRYSSRHGKCVHYKNSFRHG